MFIVYLKLYFRKYYDIQELHAHLSGCIRENTLLELINKSNELESTKEALIIAKGDRSLKK